MEGWLPYSFDFQFDVEGRELFPEKGEFIMIKVCVPADWELKQEVFCPTNNLLFIQKNEL